MKIWDAIKGIFRLFGSFFRDGLDKFILNKFEEGVEIAVELFQRRKFFNTDEYARALWVELRARFPKEPGTWLTILAGYLCDALKKRGLLNFTGRQDSSI